MSKIGIGKFHYAVQSAGHEDSATADAQYEAAVAVPGLVSVDVQTESEMNTLYADDIAYETAQSAIKITLNLDMADCPLQMQADLLGHTYDAQTKEMIKKGSDTSKYAAVMFEFHMANGSTQCVKLYKGKFSEVAQTGNTRGENVDFQTNTLTGEFVALKGKANNAGKWQFLKEYASGESTDAFYTAPIVSPDPTV